MRRLLAIVAIVLAAPVESARAEGCSSDSDSTSASVFDDSNTTPPCLDSTDVHGYRECTKFGAWSDHRPGLFIAAGATTRVFASALGTRTNQIEHEGESFTYRVVGPSEKAATAMLATFRVGLLLGRGMYVAVDGELGGLTENPATASMLTSGDRGTPRVDSGSVAVGSMLGVFGGGIKLGALGVGVEAAGGFRALSYSFESQYGACTDSSAVTTAMPVLEGRARAEVWVTPFVAVGATAGKSVIDDAWLAGLHVALSTRAFGR